MTERSAITEHEANHQRMTLWAAECAAHVLEHFEARHAKDARPREAVEVARGWVREKNSMQQARDAAFAAHAAARDAHHPAAHYAARAAGHAAESAHLMAHARHAAAYAVTAAMEAVEPADSAEAAVRERNWQYRRLQSILQPTELMQDSAATKKKSKSRAAAPKRPAKAAKKPKVPAAQHRAKRKR